VERGKIGKGVGLEKHKCKRHLEEKFLIARILEYKTIFEYTEYETLSGL
jgi:hypothetical protein